MTFTVASTSSGFRLPDPPGCIESGCITGKRRAVAIHHSPRGLGPHSVLTKYLSAGPPQRRYVEALRNRLGWLPLETDEDKKWVQMMSPFLINPDDYVTAFSD